MWFLLGLTLSLISPPCAAEDSSRSDWTQALSTLRATPHDLDLRPELYDGPLRTDTVEKVLKDPVSAEAALSSWDERISSSKKSSELIDLGSSLLGFPAQPIGKTAALPCPGWPASLNSALAPVIASLVSAQRKTLGAASFMTEPDRQAALELVKNAVLNEDFMRPPDGAYSHLSSFEIAPIIEAASDLTGNIDGAISQLMKFNVTEFKETRRCPLPGGDFVVLDAGDRDVAPAELENASLLLNPAGQKRYQGSVAAAGPGQVRVLIDLGHPQFNGPTGPTLGSGVFGIGLAYLLNLSSGTKISAGDISLGAGLFGVGGAFLRGDALEISSTRFGQGAAAFGVGALSVKGDGLHLEARFSSQGFGFTRGAGLLKVKGAGASLRGGLYYADPHEPVAFNSFCQGVGVGPRAFAGGGLGLAHVEGVSASLESGYFSQGAGYWHGFGALFLDGDGGRLKARRYSQGAGIHSAAGALVVNGSFNRTTTWGVGPGYGWDDGAGFFFARGGDNLFQADWATGRSELNSATLVRLAGDRNRLYLPGLGTGTFRRAGPSYAAALVSGKDNRLLIAGLSTGAAAGPAFMPSPWGVVTDTGSLRVEPHVDYETPNWPAADREAESKREHELLRTAAAALSGKPGPDLIKAELFAAAAAGFDMETMGNGALGLLGLEPAQAADLVTAADPDRFDESLWLRLAAAGLGEPAATAAEASLSKEKGRRKALLLDLLRYGPARVGVPAAQKALDDPDARVRRLGASVLGTLLGEQGGDEPGRLRQLDASLGWLDSDRRSTVTLVGAMGLVRLPDLLSYLSLGATAPGAQRWALLKISGNPFDTVSNETVVAYGVVLAQNPARRAALARELSEARASQRAAAQALLKLLSDSDPWVRATALTALGQLASEADQLAKGLDDPNAVVREAAASALGRLGRAGLPGLEKALGSALWERRAAAVAGLAQSPENEAIKLLRKAFEDPDERVRMAAVAAPAAFQTLLAPLKKDLLPDLDRLVKTDSSAAVKTSASVMRAAIAPAP